MSAWILDKYLVMVYVIAVYQNIFSIVSNRLNTLERSYIGVMVVVIRLIMHVHLMTESVNSPTSAKPSFYFVQQLTTNYNMKTEQLKQSIADTRGRIDANIEHMNNVIKQTSANIDKMILRQQVSDDHLSNMLSAWEGVYQLQPELLSDYHECENYVKAARWLERTRQRTNIADKIEEEMNKGSI